MKIHNLTIYCNDVEESVKFYTSLFSFNLINRFQPKADVKLANIEKDGLKIELLERVGAPKVVFSDFTTTVGFAAENIENEYERLKTKQIMFKSPLRNIGPKTKIFEVYDPNGYPLYIIQED